MKILLTGAAGFIGLHVARILLERGDELVGIDNLNDYYDPKLKLARLECLKPYANWESYQASLDALVESRAKMKANQRPALPEDEAFVALLYFYAQKLPWSFAKSQK